MKLNFLTIDIHPDHDFYLQGKDKKMHYVEMKSDYLLSDFIRYCIEHQEQRFWQALKSWSGADSIEYVKVIDADNSKMTDTYYFENKDR